MFKYFDFDLYKKYKMLDGFIINKSTAHFTPDILIEELNIPDTILNKLFKLGVEHRLSSYVSLRTQKLTDLGLTIEEIVALYNFLDAYLDPEHEDVLAEIGSNDQSEKEIVDVLKDVEDENLSTSDDGATSLDLLKLNNRARNVLLRNKINTVEKLLQCDIDVLKKLNGMGLTTLRDIELKIDIYQNANIETMNENKPLSLDTKLKYLDISNKAKHIFSQNNIITIKDILMYPTQDICNLKQTGKGTTNEIKKIIYDLISEQKELLDFYYKFNFPFEFSTKFYSIDNERIIKKGTELSLRDIELKLLNYPIRALNLFNAFGYKKLSDLLCNANNINIKTENLGSKTYKLIHEISIKYFEDNAKDLSKENPLDILRNEIFNFIFNQKFMGIKRDVLLEIFLKDNSEEDIDFCLADLISKNKIITFDKYYIYKFPCFTDYVNTLENDKIRNILTKRLNGSTLDDIGNIYGVTRERVRQIQQKFIKRYIGDGDSRMMYFREDMYEYLYTTYSLTYAKFAKAFCEPESTWNYLVLRYQHGEDDIENALYDENINPVIHKYLGDYIRADSIKIGGSYFVLSKKHLIEDYFEKYVLTPTHINEIYDGFKNYLIDNNVPDWEYYFPELPRILEARFGRSSKILFCKLGKIYRYYDFNSYDFTELLDTLDLESYMNFEISSDLLFKKYPALMKSYDIQNKYELHYILKKIIGIKDPLIHFTRSPNIVIGDFDRQSYIKSIISRKEITPFNEVVETIKEDTGVEENIIVADWIKRSDYDYSNGLFYNRSSKNPFTDDEFKFLKMVLTDEFYYLEWITKLARTKFPNFDETKLSIINLHELGYDLYVNYVVRHGMYPREYFEKMLSADYFTYDLYKLHNKNNVFINAFYRKKYNFDFIEFKPENFISLTKLRELGITKDMIYDFAMKAITHIPMNAYFTISSLKKSGFYHSLFDFNYDDIFYVSCILIGGSIQGIKINNQDLLKNSYRKFSKYIFFKNLIENNEGIKVNDLIKLVNSDYDIVISQDDIKKSIYDTEIFYDVDEMRLYSNFEASR